MRYAIALVGGIFIGLAISCYMLRHSLTNNVIMGYHCAPITQHSSMESAKRQVRLNQAMAEG